MDEQDLIWQLRNLTDVQPFAHQVVQSPWHSVIDVPSLHNTVKAEIQDLLSRCAKQVAIRCLTYYGPPGLGKTHLLNWTRQHIQENDKGIFIYITPYTGGGISFEHHLLQGTLEALGPQQSQRQARAFTDNVRHFLVSGYDEYVKRGKKLNALRAGNFWSRLLNYWTLKIGKRDPAQQEKALRQAFQLPDFLRFGYAKFAAEHPSRVEGIQTDYDAFVAAAMLCCGDLDQRWTALEWFANRPLAEDTLRQHHLQQRCQGLDKVRNTLFTLQKLVGQPFCFTFDQMEDTLNSFRRLGSPTHHINQMSSILRQLMVIPGFALIFAFIQDVWARFGQVAERMLVQRMTEGTGALGLSPLKDESAYELIECRMREIVWKPLGLQPPMGNPYFPFSRQVIRQLRKDTNGVLRDFLITAHQKFKELISKEPSKPEPAESLFTITGFEPTRVPVDEPFQLQIRGEALPDQVVVSLGKRELPSEQWSRQNGIIVVQTKLNKVGTFPIEVRDAQDASNQATVALEVFEVPMPELRITAPRPPEIVLEELTTIELQGKNIPEEIQLFVGDQLLSPQSYAIDSDLIRFTVTPTTVGPVTIRVVDAKAAHRSAETTLQVANRLSPPSPSLIQITRVEPQVIVVNQRVLLRIHGEHLPGEVDLYIGGTHFGMNAYRLHGDRVEMHYQPRQSGEFPIEIRDAYNKENRATALLFVESAAEEKPKAQRPYAKSLDRQLLRNKREELGLTQKEVAQKIGKYASYVSELERDYNKPDDEVFEALCQLYGESVDAFIKQNSPVT